MLIFVLILAALLIYLAERLLYSRFWKRGLDIQVSFDGRSAFEGETGTLTEIVSNRNFLPLPFLHAKFRIGTGLRFEGEENVSVSDLNYKNDIFAVLFYQKVTRHLTYSCRKRGFYKITDADLVSSDLFYTVHMAASFRQHSAFYVYPGRIDTSLFDEPLKKLMGEISCRSFLYPDPFEFRGLRAYTVNDPMNTINWKATARSGELTVNTYDATISRRVILLLNVEDETLMHRPALHEESIRIVSGIASRLLEEGCPVRIVTNGRDTETGETLPVLSLRGSSETEDALRLLARIDLGREPEAFAPMLLHELDEEGIENAGVILISSSTRTDLQEAYERLTERTAAFWAAPLFKNMQLHADSKAEIYRWEVDGYA